MFQSFETESARAAGPERLARLRAAIAEAGIDAFLVPRADAHQGEYVAPRDTRLQWLTGFTGSAGFAVVTAHDAAIFVDGRYRVQVREQVDPCFAPVDWPKISAGDWLKDHLEDQSRVGFDPWLHTRAEIDGLVKALGSGVAVLPVEPNPLDAIWSDQPDPPRGRAREFPAEIAGRTREEKVATICECLSEAGQAYAVLTLADSISWFLNIRGSDIPRNPVVHAFAIVEAATRDVRLFVEQTKLAGLDLGVPILPPAAIVQALSQLSGPVQLDRDTAPYLFGHCLEEAGIEIAWAPDPCLLPKARKTDAETEATREAHLRDGAAICGFLHWIEEVRERVAAGERITEIDVVRELESRRAATGQLLDIAFDTIAGSGPHAALPHYRVTEQSDRALAGGELLLVDSGGQYPDGTTDVTRTIALGPPGEEEVAAYTRVLKGMIAISRARWPEGLAGRDLDALARAPLWHAGQDYDHGTGHGVGVALSVHEGPQRLSRRSEVPLEPGMILSNEPGYYREGAFGIRIENLVVVRRAAELPGADPDRDMLAFETLTWAPLDHRLIDTHALSPGERAWIDAYHSGVVHRMTGRVHPEVADWLGHVCAPLDHRAE